MLFNQNRTLQGASAGLLAAGHGVFPLRDCGFLFFDAYEHLSKEIAFQFLPRLLVLSHSDGAMQSQFPEPFILLVFEEQRSTDSSHIPVEVQAVPILDAIAQIFRYFL